ncbi:MAG: histidine phosphatase family protein, partial [Bacilli bacterium]|nr:histidine phosphatase family protein [Bacilli bacterium]
MKIYLMRHGQTDWNVKRLVQGRTDTDLNDNGIAQAYEAASLLKEIKLDIILSSPLKRAYKTSLIIAKDKNIPSHCIESLLEMSFGDLEGKPIETTGDQLYKFFKDPINYVPS